MNINWITKTFRYVGRSFQGMGVRREAKGGNETISKKILLGQRAGFLCKTKNGSERNIQYYSIHHTDIQRTLETYFLSRKTNVSDFIFFNIDHGRGSLEDTFTNNVSLVLLTKIQAHWKNLKSSPVSIYCCKYYYYCICY